MPSSTFVVNGMSCSNCVSTLSKNLGSLEGVLSVDVEIGLATIQHENIDEKLIVQAIELAGFTLEPIEFSWTDKATWITAAHNTKWCLVGCSIGDFGTIAAFQFLWPDSGWDPLWIMALAMINGILTSIALETVIMMKQMPLGQAFRVAIGMSLISMLGMEASMNLTDLLLTGGAMLTWWVIPIMLLVGFLTPWPYNYWRLKKYGKSCH